MKKQILILFLLVLLTGCKNAVAEAPATTGTMPPTTPQTEPVVTEPVVAEPADPLLEKIAAMTLEEKVWQLFMIQPESLEITTDPSAITPELFELYPVGGLLITGDNVADGSQIRQFTAAIRQAFKIPALIATDEEGGTVSRFANKDALKLPKYKNAATVGASGDPADALEMGRTIGGYLKDFGINMDLAPVADVHTNPKNPIIGKRAFSSDPEVVREMVQAMAQGLREQGIIPTYKHFPGHGDTAQDSHRSLAVSEKTAEQLQVCEWLPYENLSADICVMVAHVALPQVTGDMTPATLSAEIIQGILRQQLGFDGVVITDAMEMQAIVNQYTDAEAAVLAIQAGCDLLLQPKDFRAAYEGLLAAVQAGEISEARIEESVYRILRLKQAYGLLRES